MAHDCDFIVVGAGIAGSSAACELARHGRVALLEAEEHPGYHSTGRSAALFSDGHGLPLPRALGAASRAFFERPPAGFAEVPLVTPRGGLWIARADQEARVEAALADPTPLREIPVDEARRLVPALAPGVVHRALLEPDAMDIDVDALLQGYLRGLRHQGGQLVTRAAVVGLEREGERWAATTAAGRFVAPVVVDAAGAWADEVAALAHVRPVGLQPMRRTALLFSAEGHDVRRWPMVMDVGEQLYFRPDAGRLMASPEDETPVAPGDARPDELDVAICVERLERATSLRVRRVEHRWAGLRSFVRDRCPVVGFAPDAPGFFWLAGQGGFGILSAPALARAAAALATNGPLPPELLDLGVAVEQLAPARLIETVG
jgi:D-arginine dehydrogenase